MKKTSLLLMLGVLLLTMNACKSELDLDKELKFSKLSVEKQKEKIENNGMEFIDFVDGVQDTKAMIAMSHMVYLTDTDLDDLELYAPMRTLSTGLKRAPKSAFRNFDRQMRVNYVESDEWGEYNYNFTTQELVKTKSLTNKMIVNFPATESSKTNNATITINYEESNLKMPDSDDLYPSKITFKMTVDSKEVMSADFSGTYFSDATPKKITASVKIEDYKWSLEVENNKKTASESYEFKKGSKTIMKSTAEVAGTLTNDEFVGVNDFEDAQDPDIKSFAISLQVMNLAVRGGTKDFKSFSDEMKIVADNQKLSEKKSMELQAALVNKYMVCTAYFADDNKKFADVEFYVEEEEDEYYDYWTEQYIVEIEYYLAPRFILSDGSKVNAEEYAQSGFDNLFERLEELMGEY